MKLKKDDTVKCLVDNNTNLNLFKYYKIYIYIFYN